MGSFPSKNNIIQSKVDILECPKGYDPEKFKKITRLFDKLDKDSNLGVTSDEIEDIARLHVENSMDRLRDMVTAKGRCLEVNNNAIRIDEISSITKIRQEAQSRRENEQRIYDATVQRLENKISWYESLDKAGKANAFMKAVTPEGGEHMDFWSFFEYMKTRTDDIQNIEYN